MGEKPWRIRSLSAEIDIEAHGGLVGDDLTREIERLRDELVEIAWASLHAYPRAFQHRVMDRAFSRVQKSAVMEGGYMTSTVTVELRFPAIADGPRPSDYIPRTDEPLKDVENALQATEDVVPARRKAVWSGGPHDGREIVASDGDLVWDGPLGVIVMGGKAHWRDVGLGVRAAWDSMTEGERAAYRRRIAGAD